jgi:hypothetical protein
MSVIHRIGSLSYLMGMSSPKSHCHMNAGPQNTQPQMNFYKELHDKARHALGSFFLIRETPVQKGPTTTDCTEQKTYGRIERSRPAPPATGEPSTHQGGVLMDAQFNGMHTHGRKGLVYDWQALLVPDEPEFSEALDEIMHDDSVVAERN